MGGLFDMEKSAIKKAHARAAINGGKCWNSPRGISPPRASYI